MLVFFLIIIEKWKGIYVAIKVIYIEKKKMLQNAILI